MKILLYILTFNQIIEQTQIIPQGKTAFNQAMLMERAGKITDAILIYERILEKNPSHQPSYFQMKNIYSQNSNYESAIILVQKWLINNPNDLQSEILLGEYFFL